MWKNRKSRTLLIANRPRSVVSKAVCPTNVRHSVALGKTAQQRRFFVMFMARFFYSVSYFYARHLPSFEMQAILIRFVKVLFLLFLFSDGMFLCFALYKQILLLNTWLLCALLSVLLTITLAYLLLDEILVRCTPRAHKSRSARRSSVPKYTPEYAYRSSLVPPVQHNVSQHYFPETPLPSQSSLDRMGGGRDGLGKPLVRVLETIDMSSTNVKHFLNTDLPVSSLSQEPGDDKYEMN